MDILLHGEKTAGLDVPAIPVSAASVGQKARIRFETLTGALEPLADLLAVMIAGVAAYFTYEWLGIGKRLDYGAGMILNTSFAFAVLFVLLLENAGAYTRGDSLLRIRETERILRVSVRAFAMVFPVTFFLGQLFSRYVLGLAMLYVPLLLVIEKQYVFMLIRDLHSRGYGVRNVIIYGAGSTGRRVFSALVRSPKLGLNPVAIVDDKEELAGQTIYEYGYKRERSVPVMHGPPTSALIRQYAAAMVVVAIPSLSREALDKVAAEAFAVEARLAFVPQLSCGTGALSNHADIDGVLIASLEPLPQKVGYLIAKRTFDVVAALALMVFTAPLWALLAALIRRDSAGPVFFHQERVGLNGKRFNLYKFRTMRVDAPKYGYHPTGSDDTRVTRFGRWLRRSSLDELPQLLNVLQGDMSLVGPRPEMPFIVKLYNDHQRQRLQVMPGITGLWQLSADRAFLIHENLGYDLYYIRHRNFFMDIGILLHTLVFAMRGV